jgi:hypothetical protein
MIIVVFKVVMLCNLLIGYQHFEGTFHHHPELAVEGVGEY